MEKQSRLQKMKNIEPGKLFIVEGIDCTGKSTLTRHMARETGAIYFHATASKKLFPGLADYHNNIMDNVEHNLANGHDIVLDRFWPSEVAYGLGCMRLDSGYQNVWPAIHNRIKKQQVCYIMCFSSFAYARYEKGHEDPAHCLSKDQFANVLAAYTEVLKFLRSEEIRDKRNLVLGYNLETQGNDLSAFTSKAYYEFFLK